MCTFAQTRKYLLVKKSLFVFECWLVQMVASAFFPVAVPAQETVRLVGSGSSTASKLFAAWGSEFNRRHANVQIAYVSTTSSSGIEQISMLRGDFAVGEIALNAEPPNGGQRGAGRTQLAAIPLAVITVVPVYNVTGRTDLRFTGELLAQIYTRKIVNWNDERIAKINPGVPLPNLPITVVERPPGTGMRFIFTDFLMRTSPEFRHWAKNNLSGLVSQTVAEFSKDVANRVASTPGAFGFTDTNLARQHKLAVGLVQNSSGRFVKPPSHPGIASPVGHPDLAGTQTVVSDGAADSYPITGFLWVYLPVGHTAPDRGPQLYWFLDWCLTDGQDLLTADYSALPPVVAERARAKLRSIVQP